MQFPNIDSIDFCRWVLVSVPISVPLVFSTTLIHGTSSSTMSCWVLILMSVWIIQSPMDHAASWGPGRCLAMDMWSPPLDLWNLDTCILLNHNSYGDKTCTDIDQARQWTYESGEMDVERISKHIIIVHNHHLSVHFVYSNCFMFHHKLMFKLTNKILCQIYQNLFQISHISWLTLKSRYFLK